MTNLHGNSGESISVDLLINYLQILVLSERNNFFMIFLLVSVSMCHWTSGKTWKYNFSLLKVKAIAFENGLMSPERSDEIN